MRLIYPSTRSELTELVPSSIRTAGIGVENCYTGLAVGQAHELARRAVVAQSGQRRPHRRHITSGFSRQQPIQPRKVSCTAVVNGALNRLLPRVISRKY